MLDARCRMLDFSAFGDCCLDLTPFVGGSLRGAEFLPEGIRAPQAMSERPRDADVQFHFIQHRTYPIAFKTGFLGQFYIAAFMTVQTNALRLHKESQDTSGAFLRPRSLPGHFWSPPTGCTHTEYSCFW